MAKAEKPKWLQYPTGNGTFQWLPVGCLNAPIFTLPDGRIFSTVNKYASITDAATIARKGGVTSVKGYSGRYGTNWLHSTELRNSGKQPSSQLDGSGNRIYPDNAAFLTRDDMRLVASQAPIYKLEVDEFFEGDMFCSVDSPLPRYYYERRKEIYDAAGEIYTSLGCYGGFNQFNVQRWEYFTGGNPVKPNTVQQFKTWLSSKEEARKSCSYFSMYGDGLIGCNIKNYIDRPDYSLQYYQKKYAMEVVNLGLGREGGIGTGVCCYLDWGKFEPLNNPLNNGWVVERVITNPDGTIGYETHPRIDYEYQVANIFIIGFCLGSGYVAFDEPDLFSPDPTRNRQFNAVVKMKNGGTPNFTDQPNFPFEPYRWIDAGYEAAYYYYLCARTAGAKWKQCRYSMDGGNTWIEPTTDRTDTLEHASAFDGPHTETGRRGRPDAMFRAVGNALDFWAFDPSIRKGTYETLLLEPIPGKRYSIILEGSKLSLYNETI